MGKQKILMTGAEGFIGFHVCKLLVERGSLVVGLDNIKDYYDVNLKYARLNEHGVKQDAIGENIVANSDKYLSFQFVRLDIVDLKAIEELFSRTKI